MNPERDDHFLSRNEAREMFGVPTVPTPPAGRPSTAHAESGWSPDWGALADGLLRAATVVAALAGAVGAGALAAIAVHLALGLWS